MDDILIVDDESDIRKLISDILIDEGFSTRLAGTSTEAMLELGKNPPALLILDIWLKDSKMDGIDILMEVKRDNPEIPVVIISGHGNIEIAVAAIKQGAYDFIEKPFNIDQLLVVIRRAMETALLRRENVALKRHENSQGPMIGESNVFRTFVNKLDKVAKFNSRVLLMGTSGCGKGIAARYIHAESHRATGPFIVVNCSTINPELMEHVLFGHETKDKEPERGLLEEAQDGMIYFNEVADLPPDIQRKILHVLVDQTVCRIGGNEKISVDFRVVSSTNRDLEELIERGSFREDLYNRLSVVPISVPSLAERYDDILLLAEHFIREFSESQGLPKRLLSEGAKSQLQTMIWPGNVRQLRNLIERVLILGEENGHIEVHELSSGKDKHSIDGRVTLSDYLISLPLRGAREAFEREYFLTQISRFGGNISKTAEFVRMERSAFHRKMRQLRIETRVKAGARVASIVEQDQNLRDAYVDESLDN
ncbi:MAG: sigma-54 dependent transcriptional regulator [Aestuariivita sp.]|nr:sigma-54 dependent transcriptional regulator [Aestuariivita sp.]